jgi:hypothetical protein
MEPDWAAIQVYEKEIGDPVLWHALLADRRIYFGTKCKYKQDYKPRFNHRQMGRILEETLKAIDDFLQKTNPDLIVSFGTATLADYLFYRFAKARGIGYLQLKATKIGNYVSLNDDAIGLSSHIGNMFVGEQVIDEEVLAEAASYVQRVKKDGLKYEGAIKVRRWVPPSQIMTGLLRGCIADLRRLKDPVTRKDNHVENFLALNFYTTVVNPLAAFLIDRRIYRQVLGAEDLKSTAPYLFFPLHFEPEVSIQVYGRPFQNQIELIRTIANCLPAGMNLLVKEHPRSKGYRPWSYYRKILEIPNVRFVRTELSTRYVLDRAKMVAVISGSTGLEAAICGKPVLTFGTPIYNVLPSSMIRHINDLNRLSWEIKDLFENYSYDQNALERFVASTIAGSVAIDLYTALLTKPGRQRQGREEVPEDERREHDYLRLADYCVSRLNEVVGELA